VARLARFSFQPRLWPALKGYPREDFVADAGAGVTVGFVALPLAMAFGIASGVRPDQGIVTAIVGGLVSLLGGSRVQIAGPATIGDVHGRVAASMTPVQVRGILGAPAQRWREHAMIAGQP
jgi:MFS superfamily sulfate permease-like transporter